MRQRLIVMMMLMSMRVMVSGFVVGVSMFRVIMAAITIGIMRMAMAIGGFLRVFGAEPLGIDDAVMRRK